MSASHKETRILSIGMVHVSSLYSARRIGISTEMISARSDVISSTTSHNAESDKFKSSTLQEFAIRDIKSGRAEDMFVWSLRPRIFSRR